MIKLRNLETNANAISPLPPGVVGILPSENRLPVTMGDFINLSLLSHTWDKKDLTYEVMIIKNLWSKTDTHLWTFLTNMDFVGIILLYYSVLHLLILTLHIVTSFLSEQLLILLNPSSQKKSKAVTNHHSVS